MHFSNQCQACPDAFDCRGAARLEGHVQHTGDLWKQLAESHVECSLRPILPKWQDLRRIAAPELGRHVHGCSASLPAAAVCVLHWNSFPGFAEWAQFLSQRHAVTDILP